MAWRAGSEVDARGCHGVPSTVRDFTSARDRCPCTVQIEVARGRVDATTRPCATPTDQEFERAQDQLLGRRRVASTDFLTGYGKNQEGGQDARDQLLAPETSSLLRRAPLESTAC